MAEFFAGCLLDRLPGPRGQHPQRFYEFAPRQPLPSLGTLARFRKQATKWPQLSLVAPKTTWTTPKGPLRPGAELDAGVDWLTRVSDIVSAFAIVIATGAELTTGDRDRELLANFVERLKPTGRTLVIAPRGLWEPEHGAPFAAQIGAVYGFDPLEHEAPEGALLYGRVRPMGARPRLTPGHLAQIAERVVAAGAERSFIAIESEQCSKESKRLAQELSEQAELAVSEVDDEDDEEEDSVDEEESEEEEDEE
ncbi:MAG TPA: hypothetical protein VFX59_23900 [Polyangiales bacterium]|nr:hypothetical protein [Polyangiales bacterium]